MIWEQEWDLVSSVYQNWAYWAVPACAFVFSLTCYSAKEGGGSGRAQYGALQARLPRCVEVL